MFAENLKRLRKQHRLSQEDMANYLGISRQGYAKYENDNSQPAFAMLIKIADKFSVSTDELIGRDQKTPQPIKRVQEPEIKSIFPFDWVGLSQEEFEGLDAYQQEVITWAASEGGPMFLNSSQNVLDMMERLEIAYEVDQAMKKRNKNK